LNSVSKSNSLRGVTISGFFLLVPLSVYAAQGPCDIYQTAGNPCVAAHSTVRALFGAYKGKLYQVRRADNTTKDILAVSAGGPADGLSQDTFCTSTCVVTKVYDQSGKGNDLEYQGSGSTPGGQDNPSTATKESFMLGGHKVYSLWIDGTATTSAPGSTTNKPNSYWVDGSKKGVPTGSAPEGVYMVTSGTHYNGGCCFDYGNSETDRKADGAGAMDAIYFGSSCWFNTTASYKCNTGSGPWIQADLEYGLFASNSSTSWNSQDVSFTNKYVTAMLKNGGTNTFALKGGNAQSGSLTTLWDGKSPYSVMKKQGAIVLGSGGDCCNTNQNQSAGTFYEGAIVAGSSIPSNATDDAVQANIVAAGYGRTTDAIDYHGATGISTATLLFDPMNTRATIRFGASRSENVSVDILDIRGHRVATVYEGMASSGRNEVVWNARGVPTGIYVARLEEEGRKTWTGKFVLGD